MELKGMLISATVGISLLSGCGSQGNQTGSASSGSQNDSGATLAGASAVISGTVATGAASVASKVIITGVDGNSACENDPVITDANGSYNCKVKISAQAPFSVAAFDAEGLNSPMVSAILAAPQAGTTAVANVSPLTTAVLTTLSSNANPYQFASDAQALATLSSDKLKKANEALRTQLNDVLVSVGVQDPASFDPVATPFVGGSHSGADLVLDQIKVSLLDGMPAFSPVDSTVAPIPLATDSSSAIVKVPAVKAAIGFAEVAVLKAQLEKCYSFADTSRVTSVSSLNANSGGPEASVIPECQNFVGDGFLQNGYRYGQFFYAKLSDPNMTNAKFSIPEIVKYVPKDDGQDEAFANFKYVDNRGFQGNFFTPIKKIGGASWKLYGNQRPADITITPLITKTVQLAPSAGQPGTAFSYAPVSGFNSGITFTVNRFGPNGVGLNYVRVKGAGLPAAGLVMAQNTQSFTGNMSIYSKDGVIPTGVVTSSTGNIYNMQVADSNGNVIAPPAGTGFNSLAYADLNEVNPKDIPAFTTYTFELFYGSETTPRYTVSAPIVSALYPASKGLSREWDTLTDATMKYLDPASSESQTTPATIPVGWNANPFASYISTMSVYGGIAVNGQYVGYTSGVVSPANIGDASVAVPLMPFGSCTSNCNYPVLNDQGGANQRQVWLRFKMFDGSTMIQEFRYN